MIPRGIKRRQAGGPQQATPVDLRRSIFVNSVSNIIEKFLHTFFEQVKLIKEQTLQILFVFPFKLRRIRNDSCHNRL